MALLANPERYHGVDVWVSGYFAADHEPPPGNLFLDEESADRAVLPNSILLELGRCRQVSTTKEILDPSAANDLRDGYVQVAGVFEVRNSPPYQVGAICGVVSIDELPDRATVYGNVLGSASASPRPSASSSRGSMQ